MESLSIARNGDQNHAAELVQWRPFCFHIGHRCYTRQCQHHWCWCWMIPPELLNCLWNLCPLSLESDPQKHLLFGSRDSMVKLSRCVLWMKLGCMPAPSAGGLERWVSCAFGDRLTVFDQDTWGACPQIRGPGSVEAKQNDKDPPQRVAFVHVSDAA